MHMTPIDTQAHATEDAATLCNDVTCILMECHRDRNLPALFAQGVDAAALAQFAALMARRLAPLIGGRYIPKRDDRAARDVDVWASFNGRNHDEVMSQFNISRRLLYSILERQFGGPYIPKRDDLAARDLAVQAAWNGRNREDVMRSFKISRRLLYSILARKRRGD